MKATDILFSEAPKEKKFGWDFHLWQFFVACLPSFAVYLTAQYARREMRRMEEERERENAEKLKTEEKDRKEETRKLPGFQTLEARLDAMEEKIREMELTKAKTIAGQVRDGQLNNIEIEKHQKNVKTGESDITMPQNVVIKVAKAPETVSQSVHSKEEPKEKPHESKQNGNPEKKGDSQQNMPSKEELNEKMKGAEKIQK